MGAKSKKAGKTDETEVILLRHGVGKQGFHLPAGATLGDLFRAADVNGASQEIFVDGKSVEELLVLEPGMVVSVVPRPERRPSVGSWREGLGMLSGDPVFLEVCEAVEKSREAEKDRS
jgi:hypothetical protein